MKRWGRRALVGIGATALLAGLPSSAAALGPVANDDAAGATEIAALPFTSESDMAGATRTPTEPADCSRGTAVPTVWFRYTAPAGEQVLLDTNGTNAATSIAVYTGTPESGLGLVSCQRKYESYRDPLVLEAQEGTTYSIQVEAPADARLVFTATQSSFITGRIVDTRGEPVDACVAVHDEQGQIVTWAWTWHGTYLAESLAPGQPYRLKVTGCNDDSVVEQWYSGKSDFESADPVVPTVGLATNADFTVSTAPSLTGVVRYDDGTPAAHVCLIAEAASGWEYTGASTDENGRYRLFAPGDGPFTIGIGCSDKAGYPWQLHDGVRTYEEAERLQIAGGIDTVAALDLTMHSFPVPPNDKFADAAPLPLDATTEVELEQTSLEPGEATCQPYEQASAWYEFTPDFTGDLELHRVSGRGSIGVYQGDSAATATNLACYTRDDPEQIHFVPVAAGETYFVQVSMDTWYSESGAFAFHAGLSHGRTDVLFDAAETPCLSTCPFNTGVSNEAPETLLPVRPPVWLPGEDEAACAAEPVSPPGSWQDHALTVPAEVDGAEPTVLRWQMSPESDWDGYICRVEPDEYGNRFVAKGTRGGMHEDCDEAGGLACKEDIRGFVRPGDQLVLRAYNWSDLAPVPTSYEYFG